MRITSDKDIKEIQDKGRKKIKKSSSNTTFDKFFNQKVIDNREAELKKLLDEIEAFGKELLLYKTPYALKKYKKKVRSFLKEIMKDFENRQIISNVTNKDGKHKIYYIVEYVNKHLGTLREDALNRIKDNLQLVSTLEELRGLIVDVFG